MNLNIEKYLDQLNRWPQTGRHIMAQFDDESIIVYQAYRPEIAEYAVQHQRFGGPFSYNRMSWIKPNFLWMMYRSGWATKPGQEHVLAICMTRDGFDYCVKNAVPSTYCHDLYEKQEDWKSDISKSTIRSQWDPDHSPYGNPVERHAIQLGLRGDTLRQYGTEWIVQIFDITNFVHEQYEWVKTKQLENLSIPKENVYPIPKRQYREMTIE